MKSSSDQSKNRLHSHQRSLKLSGFTLVEIMIVVAVIAILAAIAIPNLQRATDESKAAAAKQTLKTVATAIEIYNRTTGLYPTNITSLTGATPPYLPNVMAQTYFPINFSGSAYRSSGAVANTGYGFYMDFNVISAGTYWVNIFGSYHITACTQKSPAVGGVCWDVSEKNSAAIDMETASSGSSLNHYNAIFN